MSGATGDRLRKAAALLDAELYAMLDDGIDPLADISAPLARLLRELADGPSCRVDAAAEAGTIDRLWIYALDRWDRDTAGLVLLDACVSPEARVIVRAAESHTPRSPPGSGASSTQTAWPS